MGFKDKLKQIRNKRKIWQYALVLFVTITLFAFFIIVLPILLSGNYGFTSKMAAGEYAKYQCIELGDYDIYWYTITEPEEMACIDGFRPVKKAFIGYTVEDYSYKQVYCNGEVVAIIYSIKGENRYYNILKKTYTVNEVKGDYADTMMFGPLMRIDKLKIEENEYEVKYNSFFITDEPVTEFYIGNNYFIVEE